MALATRYMLASPKVMVSAFRLPGSTGDLQDSSEYTFRIEEMPYEPAPRIGALHVHDADGLVLSVVTRVRSEDPATPPPAAGWEVTAQPLGLPWSERGCGAKGQPQSVTFSVDSEKVQLMQGSEATLGDYDIYLLAAEEIDYSDVDCLDYGVAELSYVIARAVN